LAKIFAQFERLDSVASVQALMCTSDRSDAAAGLAKLVPNVLARGARRVQLQHAGDDLQAVVDPVIDLSHENLLPIECLAKVLFHALALDCHAEDVGDPAQKYDIGFAEFAFGLAVHLENPKRSAVAAEDDVHGAPDAILNEQFR